MQTNGTVVVFSVHLCVLTLVSILSLSSVRLSLFMLICLRTTSQGSIVSSFLNQLSIHPFAQRFVTLLRVFIYTCFWQASHLLVSVYILQAGQPTGRAVFLLVNHLLPLHPFVCSCLRNQHMEYPVFGVCPHLRSIYFTKLRVMCSFEMHVLPGWKGPPPRVKEADRYQVFA